MDSENSRKQYEDLLLEAMEKIIRLAPRKSDQLKTEASKAAEIVQNEGPDERDANKYFFILKMALDIGSNKLRIQILSCIQKLISHGFLDGDCDDNCIYADGGRANHGNSKYARKLIDAIVESICNCVEDGDSDVHLQVIKCIVTLISTVSCKIHESSLLDGFRACYKIHLSTTNSTNSNVSKVSLHQMMTIVFKKMEAYAGNFGVDIQTIQKSLDAKFNSRKKPIPRLQKDFGVTEFAASSFFNEEEDYLEVSRDETDKVGTQINFSSQDQYLYMLCQNMVDNVCIYHSRRDALQAKISHLKSLESKEDDTDKVQEELKAHIVELEHLNIRVVPRHQRKTRTKPAVRVDFDCDNEKGIPCGKFGWCVVCRKEANLYCKDTFYSICSLDCKQRLLNLLDGVDSERNSSLPQLYNNEEMKRHFTDAILLFKSICKLFMKAETTNMNTYTLKSQIMGLELILNVVEKPGATFLTRPEFINIIKTSLCNGLLRHCVSNEKTVFALSISIFYALFVHFREHLKFEILVLIEEIFLKVLNSGNSNYHHKYLILRVFDKIAKNTKHLIEIFVNYDCDVESKDILEKMIDTLSKIAQGKFSKTEHSNMLTEKEEHSLKLYALKILASIVTRLNQFLSEEHKEAREEDNKQQSSGAFKNEFEDDEEESPHFMHHSVTETSISMSNDPRKDNYERNRALKSNINKAATKFNLKPKKGIEYLLDFNNAKDIAYEEKLELILNFIKTTPTLNLTAIGDYLGEDIQMNKDVLYKLVDSNDFVGKDIVTGLRILLSFFRLPGEGQKVDRIMEKFGEKYVQDNPGTVGDSECIYLLSYSIMMLQTGLHNPSAKQLGMGMDDFKKQARLIKPDFTDEFLEQIFYTIEKEPISLKEDDEARLKQESSSANSYKRKQEIFIKEGQGLAKRGYELMKDKKKTTQFILVNNSDAIGPLFESCWSAMFAVFSMLLELHDDPNILALCIDGFLHSIKICGYYNMSTERNAFVSSLVNFTGIYKVTDNDGLLKRELTEKNVKCTQAIIHLAMHEGNYLADSWENILKVVSMINYYHNVGSGARGYQDLFTEMEPRSSDPEAEAIKAQNAAHILTAIDEGDIDMIFSNSKALNQLAIVDLIKSMCNVSREELKKAEGPRIFLLQKLVEVCDMNMNRARIEFSNMWNVMKDHISTVGSHDNEQVAVYAIDSLRQLAKKFLEKEELNNYHFQKHFLEPFNIIVLNNMPMRMGIIHFIMSCMCSFAKQMTKNLKSGWEIIIEIFKFGGENDNDELSKEAIETLNIILEKENFQYVEEYFEKIINCLVKFMNNTFEDHAMLALDLIERVATYLGSSNEFVERIIEKSREMFNTRQEKLEYKKRLWKCVLYELSKKSFEPKTNVTQRATQLMFSLLTKYNEGISPALWDLMMRDLLKAIFDDVHIKLETKSTDQEMHNTYLANTDTMVSNLIGLFNTMENEKFSASVKILFDTIRNFSSNYPNSPISNVMLEGMKELSKHCKDRFDKDLCKAYIDVVCNLFDNKEDKNLLEPHAEIEKEESKYGTSKRLTIIYQTQASRLLKLIENGQQITEFFKILDSDDCQRILKNIEYAYDVSHDFNMNIQRRYNLYTKIDLKTMHEKIPILLKHHIKCLEIYFELLNGLYNNPKEGINKEEITFKIIEFSTKVLKEFASNYDKMLHMGMELTSGQNTQKYGSIDFEEAIEEMKRILVSISDRVSNSVLKTLRNLHKSDLKPHVKTLTPLLIDCTVCDQLQFNLRLKEILKKMFKLLVDE